MNLISQIKKHLSIYKPKKHIFLLSHMRANTSIFGHILGGHEEIEGYYEMHIGYYSWKSLIRQKILFYKNHPIKPSATYIFDKVLHDEHLVSPDLLIKNNVYTIMSLREPEQTVKSIMALYKKVNPNHEFATAAGAVAYYIKRTKTLAEIAAKVKGKYVYIDAQCLRDKTDESLTFLTNELKLSSKLSSTYKTQLLTGKGKGGDNSGNLELGKIKQGKSNYSDVEIPSESLLEINNTYKTAREELIKLASNTLIM
jgi:hypothetical protein